jgi:hypothetical protein
MPSFEESSPDGNHRSPDTHLIIRKPVVRDCSIFARSDTFYPTGMSEVVRGGQLSNAPFTPTMEPNTALTKFT